MFVSRPETGGLAMSAFGLDDYVAGGVALLIIFGVMQLALYLGRHAHVRREDDHEH